MAVTNKNEIVKPFANSGKVIVYTDGSTGLNLLNCKRGTLKLTAPYREPIVFTDRNVVQPPLSGEGKPGSFELTLQSGDFASTSAYKAFCDNCQPVTTSHAHTLFPKVEIVFMDGPGATAGKMLTLTDAWLSEPPSFAEASGNEPDTITIKGNFLTGGNVEATYPAA